MSIDFEKGDGLVPVIIQDARSLQVLMLGYMNAEAYEKTKAENRVTFYSRSKGRLWTKGESSQNYLEVVDMWLDCDQDALLIKANPKGPTCHTGQTSCFANDSAKGFIYDLEGTIEQRIKDQDPESYTYKLIQRGVNKVAQKVGEEAVELVIEAKDQDDNRFVDEAADLMYHFLILLQQRRLDLETIEGRLKERSK